MLGSMSGVYKVVVLFMPYYLLCLHILETNRGDLLAQRETVSLMTSMLDPLMEQFSVILNSPVLSQNPDEWSMQMEVYIV
jgi:hypothetical protein